MSDAALNFTTTAEDRGAGATFDDLVGKLDSLVDALGRTGGSASDTAVNNLSRVGDVAGITNVAVGSLVADGLVKLGGALVGVAGDSIQVAADFESGMNRFASVTGSSITDASLTLDDFQNKFLELGAVTQFSAAQAQDAAIALAKGGVAIPDIMAGATQATLDLAAAGELELAPAADIVAKQLGVWGETGVTAAQVADSLAQAANASTVDVDELALGLANVGGSAKVAGVDFGDLVQTMALIAPGFSSSADAGTSLKTMISRLIPTTNDAKSAMRDLGLLSTDTAGMLEYFKNSGILPATATTLDLHDGMMRAAAGMSGAKQGSEKFGEALAALERQFEINTFYDAEGQFLGMENAAQQLHETTKDLSEEQKALAFNTIFGADAVRAAAAVANAGAEGFTQMGASMTNAGSAADQATQRNQGLNFAVDSLKGTLETLQIVVGMALLPVLTTLIADVVTPGANAFLSFAQAVLGAGDPFAGFLSAVEPVAPMLAGLATSVLVAVVPAFWAWAAAATTTAAANIAALAPVLVPIAAIGAAVGLLVAAWQADFLGIQGITMATWSAIVQLTAPVIAELSRFWTEIQPHLIAAWSNIQVQVSAAWTAVSGLLMSGGMALAGFMIENWNSIELVVSGTWQAIQGIVQIAWSLVTGIITTGLAVLSGEWGVAWAGIETTLNGVWAGMQTYLSGAWEVIQGTVQIGVAAVGSAVSGLAATISGLAGSFAAAALSIGSNIIDGIISGVRAGVGALVGAVEQAATDALDAARSLLDINSPSRVFASEVGAPIVEGIVKGILDNADDVGAALGQLFDAGSVIGSLGSTVAGQIKEQQLNPLKGALDGITDEVDQVTREMVDINKLIGVNPANDAALQQRLVDLDAQRAALLGKQANARKAYEETAARIAAFEQQQANLQFLQQQVKLLDLISEHGLDAAKVLGGIQLGVNADPDALLAAMTRALEGVVGQVSVQAGIPAFAEGTDFAPGGVALVGEEGAELVHLPRGSSVDTASETRELLGGAGGGLTITIHIDARGAMDPRAVEEAGYRGAQRALREAGARGDVNQRMRGR